MIGRLRRASVADAPVCWHIRNSAIREQCAACYPLAAVEAWTPQVMPESYPQAIIEHCFYVIEDVQGELLATGYLDRQTQRLEAIFTRPSAMGQGCASHIVEKLKEEALQQGLSAISLSSTLNAQPFYLKQGFIPLRHDCHFSVTAGCYLDCVEMYCPLTLPGD
ncbi:GNAT family N-acetyltransferase [Tatumella sp. TA1]|nr:GNAT family N-acetyltransferase [Tatumella sp. TA1]